MRIEYLYRYPVKGLSAEALETAEVQEGRAITWDRDGVGESSLQKKRSRGCEGGAGEA